MYSIDPGNTFKKKYRYLTGVSLVLVILKHLLSIYYKSASSLNAYYSSHSIASQHLYDVGSFVRFVG